MQSRVTCAIIDDHLPFRERLEQLLALLPDVECRLSSNSAHGTVNAVLSALPDIVFVNTKLKGKGGFSFWEELRRKGLNSKIIFTAYSLEYSVEALKCGAFDYLVHPIDFDELKAAIKRVAHVSERENHLGSNDNFLAKLTPKQKEIVELLAEGKTSREIAKTLGITKNTVDTHRRRIIEKAGVSSILQLVMNLKGCN